MLNIPISFMKASVPQGETSYEGVTGLIKWHKGTDLVTASGSDVSLWGDKSTGPDAEQLTVANMPQTNVAAAEINSINAIRFEAASDFMEFASRVTGLTDVTAFAVAKPNGAGGNNKGTILGDKDGNNNQICRYSNINGAGKLFAYDDANLTTWDIGTDEDDVPRIITNIFDTSDSSVTIRANGVEEATGTYSDAIEFGTMCSLISGAISAGIDVAEILVFDRVLDSTDIDTVEDALNTEYSIY